jgi:hypothetical protein
MRGLAERHGISVTTVTCVIREQFASVYMALHPYTTIRR